MLVLPKSPINQVAGWLMDAFRYLPQQLRYYNNIVILLYYMLPKGLGWVVQSLINLTQGYQEF